MRLVVCDPALDSLSGHHRFFDQEICAEAMSRSFDAIIFAHRDYPRQELLDIPIRRVFSCTCYETTQTNSFTQQFDDFVRYNDAFFEDMISLGTEIFSKNDLVLFPTVTENILFGIAKWIRTIPSDSCPTIVVLLMMPSGILLNDSSCSQYTIVDPIKAMLYRLALREFATFKSHVVLLGSSISHAKEQGISLGSRNL